MTDDKKKDPPPKEPPPKPPDPPKSNSSDDIQKLSIPDAPEPSPEDMIDLEAERTDDE